MSDTTLFVLLYVVVGLLVAGVLALRGGPWAYPPRRWDAGDVFIGVVVGALWPLVLAHLTWQYIGATGPDDNDLIRGG